MNNQTIVCCVVALLLGMLLANMLKNVCGCKVVEGQNASGTQGQNASGTQGQYAYDTCAYKCSNDGVDYSSCMEECVVTCPNACAGRSGTDYSICMIECAECIAFDRGSQNCSDLHRGQR